MLVRVLGAEGNEMKPLLKYWKRLLAGCAAVSLLVAIAAVFGIDENPVVMRGEFIEVAERAEGRWLRRKQRERNDVKYQIYLLEKRRETIPRFLFDKLNQIDRDIEKIKRRLRKK